MMRRNGFVSPLWVMVVAMVGCSTLPPPVAPNERPGSRPADSAKVTPQTGLQTAPELKVTRMSVEGRSDWPPGVERIEYVSSVDGVADWALTLPAAKPDTWVVQIHGHGSTGDQIFTRRDMRDHWLPLYRESGFGILSVNLRGNGWMSPAVAADLHALLAFIRKHYHVGRFILASASMGGTSNLIFATLHPEDIAGVVALCPASDLTTYYHWCRQQEKPPVLREIANAIESSYGGPPEQRAAIYQLHSAVVHADRLTMPVYVVHAAGDAVIPASQSRALAAAVGARSTFHYLELPGGNHETPKVHMQEALAWVLQRADKVRGER